MAKKRKKTAGTRLTQLTPLTTVRYSFTLSDGRTGTVSVAPGDTLYAAVDRWLQANPAPAPTSGA